MTKVAIELSAHYVHQLRRQYGITPEEFVAIANSQYGCCPICQLELGVDLVVDHDHSSMTRTEFRRLAYQAKRKLVRGVLHRGCNTWLGRTEKWPWLISEHVRNYLDKPPAQQVLIAKVPEFPDEMKLRSRKGRGGRRAQVHQVIDGVEYRWCENHEDWHKLVEWRVRKQGEYTLYTCRERSRELKRKRRTNLRSVRGD